MKIAPATRQRLLAALLAGATLPAAAEDALGRLFFTPEQRASLDRERELRARGKAPADDSDVLAVDGLVTRSSGKRTVWVNGVPIDENSRGKLRLRPPPRPDTASLADDGAPPSSITVGTALNRSSGARSDALNGGRILVSPAATPHRLP